jgi:restriction system protein
MADDSDKKAATNTDETPQETLERVHGELNKVLGDELLGKIHEKPPEFFEKLVIDLMAKMGYGSGKVTQLTRDDGIDGIVYQDKLGFDVIFVQAKRYDLDKTIGAPELRQFGGAIANKKGKGMYVTTARFTKDAIKYADEQHIILIDGKRLAQLMIEFDYGVSTVTEYKIKRIDTDLFEDE